MFSGSILFKNNKLASKPVNKSLSCVCSQLGKCYQYTGGYLHQQIQKCVTFTFIY